MQFLAVPISQTLSFFFFNIRERERERERECEQDRGSGGERESQAGPMLHVEPSAGLDPRNRSYLSRNQESDAQLIEPPKCPCFSDSSPSCVMACLWTRNVLRACYLNAFAVNFVCSIVFMNFMYLGAHNSHSLFLLVCKF